MEITSPTNKDIVWISFFQVALGHCILPYFLCRNLEFSAADNDTVIQTSEPYFSMPQSRLQLCKVKIPKSSSANF